MSGFCHPEAAESLASDSQRRICALLAGADANLVHTRIGEWHGFGQAANSISPRKGQGFVWRSAFLGCDKSRSVSSKNRTSLHPRLLFQAQFPIVLLRNLVALAGGDFEFLAIYDLHCAAGVLDELLLLQNAGCHAHARPICP